MFSGLAINRVSKDDLSRPHAMWLHFFVCVQAGTLAFDFDVAGRCAERETLRRAGDNF